MKIYQAIVDNDGAIDWVGFQHFFRIYNQTDEIYLSEAIVIIKATIAGFSSKIDNEKKKSLHISNNINDILAAKGFSDV